jgi:NADH:ubiquinone oxidoreductase subunit C
MATEGYDYLVKITAVDYVDHIDVLYVVRDIAASKDQILEVALAPQDLWVPTIMSIHPSADWYERELSEMFGIRIDGRSAPRLFLEKWDGVDPPLRKSFKWDVPYRTKETESK